MISIIAHYILSSCFLPPWNKNVPEIIKIDHVRFLIYLHQQPLDAKRYKTSIYQSKPKQPKATQSNPKQTMTTTNALFKVYIENMPEALNTKKDVDEYCKQFWKDNKEKVKEEKAAGAARQLRRKSLSARRVLTRTATPRRSALLRLTTSS